MFEPLQGLPATAIEAAKKVRLLLLDVDGILTDGQLLYSSTGEELKSFNIKDGLGIKLLQKAGIDVGIITGRNSAMVQRRANELGIKLILQGREDKFTALNELIANQSIQLDEIAYMGDDLPDLAAIKAVGLGATVADGNALVQQYALYQTQAQGGRGAVRELAELILAAQDKYQQVTATFQS